jgi:hypothetical protein
MATGRRAADAGPPSCLLPGAVPASRVLLASSPSPGVVRVLGQSAVRVLQRWRTPALGYRDATLVFCDRAGLERTAGRFWESQGGRVEEVDGRYNDLVGAVEHVDVVLAFLLQLDPEVMAVLGRADEVGVPVVLHHVGPYPYPEGSEQAARAAEARALRGHE